MPCLPCLLRRVYAFDALPILLFRWFSLLLLLILLLRCLFTCFDAPARAYSSDARWRDAQRAAYMAKRQAQVLTLTRLLLLMSPRRQQRELPRARAMNIRDQ